MFASTQATGLPGFASDTCRLPVHNLSSQTRHIVDNRSVELYRSQKMLSLFVLVLSVALATVLCLLVTSSPVYAMQMALQPRPEVPGNLVALGAFLSLFGVAGIAIALVKVQITAFYKR